MPPTFRYRYVDIGTVFIGDARMRDPHGGDQSPATLFANELACDVGGSCWGPNQPLSILDHHQVRAPQFPSASAAVLHKSALIREKFSQMDGLVWLVTNNEPEFDALCSLYLARWVIQDPRATGFEGHGLNPDGWTGKPGLLEFNWLQPDLHRIPAEHHWALRLASYASMVEMRRHIPCGRARQLRSILYAALKRGRDYLTESSGASEFFDEVRANLEQKQINPMFDSVLEGSALFALELAMLDREQQAYASDLERARKALVFLPEAEAPTPDFFEHPKKAAQPADTRKLNPQQLLLADSFRILTDGIYLLDPQCALFQEWARADVENSALGAGFEFTAIAHSNQRPAAPNTSEYEFYIDPQRANGRHLHTVWSRLETEEVAALRARKGAATAAVSGLRGSASASASESVETVLAEPWTGGQSGSSTRVKTPHRGTFIAPAGMRCDLRDDPVVEAVRTELEAPVYSVSSLAAGPQITVYDFAASEKARNAEPRRFDLINPLAIPSPEAGCFRFASVGLRPDVPIVERGRAGQRLARQIGENLWHCLHPDGRGAAPQDFERHLVTEADKIGVWSERGIVVAYKASASAIPDDAEAGEREDFAALVSLVREIDWLAAELETLPPLPAARKALSGRKDKAGELEPFLSEAEDLATRALEIQHTLALPQRELLRRFCEVIGFEQIVARLNGVKQALAEHLRRQQADEEARRREKHATATAALLRELRWFQLFVIGFIGLELLGMIARNMNLQPDVQEMLVWVGNPLVLAIGAWLLQPWRARRGSEQTGPALQWIVLPALLVWLAAWIAQMLRLR